MSIHLLQKLMHSVTFIYVWHFSHVFIFLKKFSFCIQILQTTCYTFNKQVPISIIVSQRQNKTVWGKNATSSECWIRKNVQTYTHWTNPVILINTDRLPYEHRLTGWLDSTGCHSSASGCSCGNPILTLWTDHHFCIT